MTKHRLLVLAVVLVVGAAATTATMGASGSSPTPPTDAEQAAVAARANAALADGSASLTTSDRGGYRIEISVPPNEAKRLPASDDAAFDPAPPPVNGDTLPLAELGWKAHMISGAAAAEDDRIVDFSVRWAGMTDDQARALRSRLRVDPGTPLPNERPRLGTVTFADARAQLASNIDVMRSLFSPTTIRRTRIVVVPVDRAQNRFGLEADIRVSRMEALKSQLRAVVNGLATGLVGDSNAVIEGLAINVVDDQGRRTGWFHATRTGVGISIVDPAFANTVAPVDATFPNLTGGPRTAFSVSASASAAPAAPPAGGR